MLLKHLSFCFLQGEPICSFYSRYSMCKFGPNCKFDHPIGTVMYGHASSPISEVPTSRRMLAHVPSHPEVSPWQRLGKVSEDYPFRFAANIFKWKEHWERGVLSHPRCYVQPSILDWSNFLQQHLRSCTGLLRFYLTFELYIPELASTCIAFRQEKVACSGCPAQWKREQILFKTYVWYQLTSGHSNPFEWCAVMVLL